MRRDDGQAAVETVALIPAVVLVALAMAQGAVAGYTAWSAGGAARVGARAEALGEDPRPAVRDVLPAVLRKGSTVRPADRDGTYAGRVLVVLRVPSLLPGLDLGTVAGRAKLPSQEA